MPSRRPRSLWLLTIAAAVALGLALANRGGGSRVPAPPPPPTVSGWRGLVGEPRAQVALGQRVVVVLGAPSLAQRVAAAGGRASDVDERRWTVAAFAAQQQLISNLGTRGIRVDPEFRFVRVVNGFSAAVDPQGIAVLERMPGVAAVYPVRAAFPAALPRNGWKPWSPPTSSLGGFDGRGVTIALLDTGVDRGHAFLRSRVLAGYDVVGTGADASPRADPRDAADVERHGTEMAGILVGRGGPDGLRGVAPGATVLPIRVAGWQRDATGADALFARTDQVLAGLERAVDPNEDGDAHDGVRIALVPLAEPFAAFADSPLSRAAAGAMQLDTLVVAPAGNDGPAGLAFGSVAGPGGAPAALTVGAADLRSRTESVRIVVRTGLDVRYAGAAPLAGAVAP